MKIAYFDCSYGVAGDMILGALVDAGAPFPDIKRAVETGLGFPGIRLRRRRIERAGVSGVRLMVKTDSAHDRHRRLSEIEEIVSRAKLPAQVKERSVEVFRLIAKAEATVHRTTPEKIHFHEVGCLDAIADVTGAMLALHLLGVDEVFASPLVVGSGRACCAHGVLPVPAPATLELLRGIPFEGGGYCTEMTTPTGAAILKSVTRHFGPQPLLAMESVGYGAGKRAIEGEANFLRVLIGTSSSELEGPSSGSGGARRDASLHATRLVLLITEIDDMNPEVLGDLMGQLFEVGCLDAHFAPIQMKKNRPGIQLQVLCEPDRRDRFVELILRQTSTFGLKAIEVDRICLPRRSETIRTEMGPLDVKVGFWEGSILKATPEYESCRGLAERSDLTLGEIYRRAEAAIQSHYFAGADARGKRRSASAKKGRRRR